jgi:hypothetical protein
MKSAIVREWRMPLLLQGTIIDVETTAIRPEEGELLTLGMFFGEKVLIYQRADPTPEGKAAFWKRIENWVEFCPRPYFAYNKSFEERWLGTGIDSDLMEKWKREAEKRVVDVNTRRTMKWPKVSELISLPHEYYGLNDIDGKEVPQLWEEYRKSLDPVLLERIIYHNLYDLIREACLYMWDETVQDAIIRVLEREKNKKGI